MLLCGVLEESAMGPKEIQASQKNVEPKYWVSANLSLSLLEVIYWRCYQCLISFADISKLPSEQRHNQCSSPGKDTMMLKTVPPTSSLAAK